MADDIGGRGEDPRDVARRRLNVGRRAREAEAARRAGQVSGPSVTPSSRSVVPYQERLPTAPEGRGGPPATSGGREVAPYRENLPATRGENAPAVRREGMPSIRVPPGSAEAMRGAMQSPMARALGTGRGAAIGRVAEGAMRLGDAARRAYRSMPARTPDTGPDEGPARAATPIPNNLPDMEPPPYEEARRPRPRPQPARRPASRRNEDPEGTEAAAEAERERQRAMTPAEERSFLERMFRRTNETGMDPATLEHRRNYLGSGAADTNVSYNKKGGLLKAKAPMKKGGAVKPKAPMKKGGAVKKAPAKMMKSGGKVAPKKMMKGGMTSKPKKMMGGGRAMYAKGGMARGCK